MLNISDLPKDGTDFVLVWKHDGGLLCGVFRWDTLGKSFKQYASSIDEWRSGHYIYELCTNSALKTKLVTNQDL